MISGSLGKESKGGRSEGKRKARGTRSALARSSDPSQQHCRTGGHFAFDEIFASLLIRDPFLYAQGPLAVVDFSFLFSPVASVILERRFSPPKMPPVEIERERERERDDCAHPKEKKNFEPTGFDIVHAFRHRALMNFIPVGAAGAAAAAGKRTWLQFRRTDQEAAGRKLKGRPLDIGAVKKAAGIMQYE
eukprot:974098-Pelagomonas_calceolata.AAC.2